MSEHPKIFVAAIEDGGSSSSSLVHYNVRLEGRQPFALSGRNERRSKQDLAWISEYRIQRLHISVNRLADSDYPVGPTEEVLQSSWRSGPSGTHIVAELTLDKNEPRTKAIQLFHKVLQRLVGDRWVAAPLVSIQQDRLHRIVNSRSIPFSNKTTDALPAMVELSVSLPFQGSPMAAEGLSMLLQKEQELSRRQNQLMIASGWEPNQAVAPFLTTLQPNATVWSQILLGRLVATTGGGSTYDRRGLWMQWTVSPPDSCEWNGSDTTTDSAVCVPSKQGYWDYGLYYSRPVPRSSIPISEHGLTLKELVPLGVARAENRGTRGGKAICPLANVSLVTLESSTDGSQWNEKVLDMSRAVPAEVSAYFGTCRDVLSETAVGLTTMPAPAAYWQAGFRMERQPYSTGRYMARIDNHHPSCSVSLEMTHTVLSVFKPVWQSLRVDILSEALIVEGASETRTISWSKLEDSFIEVLEDKSIRFHVRHGIPRQASLVVSFDFDPLFLPFETFPADPNRGFEIPPLFARLTAHGCSLEGHSADLYSDAVLFLPPVPDMSMPFNVLSLTCTLYVLIIGSLINHIVRKSSERVKYTLYPEQKPKSKLQKVKDKVRTILRRGKPCNEPAPVQESATSKGQDDKDSSPCTPPNEPITEPHSNKDEPDEHEANQVEEESPAKVLLDQLLWKIPVDHTSEQPQIG